MSLPKIRVLHVVVCLGSGGVETLLLDWVKRLPPDIHFDFLVLHKGERENIAIEKGCMVHYLPREIAFKPWRHAQHIENLVKKYGYNVIHNHRFAFTGNILSRMKKLNVPGRIAHSHHILFQEEDWKKRLLYLPYHCIINRLLLLGNATHIFGCSNEAGRFMMGPFWSLLSKCIILHNGIAINDMARKTERDMRDALCARYSIPNDALVVGNLGRMSPVKNQLFLIDIFSILAKRNELYWLFIGGEGELLAQLQNHARKLGISERVRMPGFCTNAQHLFENLFDVFCLPSLAEGFGIVLIESAAAGLFSVCSNSIPKDIISRFPQRFKSLPVNVGPDAWAEALEDGIKKRICSAEGAALIADSPFTAERQFETVIDIYQQCVGSSLNPPWEACHPL